MKDIRGWSALAVFCVSCFIIGNQGYLLKNLNPTIIVMLALSVVIVVILDEFKKKSGNEKSEKNKKER